MIYIITKSSRYNSYGEPISLDAALKKLSYIEGDLGFDTETTGLWNGNRYRKEGLDPYLSKVIMIQFGTDEVQFVMDSREFGKEEVAIVLREVCKHTLVGHNLKFDYVHILHNYNVRLLKVYDTQLVEEILAPGKPYKGLAELSNTYLSHTMNKAVRNEFKNIGNTPFTKEQIVYGAEDIKYPLKIKEKQLEKHIIPNKMEITLRLESKFMLCLADIEYKGMQINIEKWKDNSKYSKENVCKLEQELTDIIYDNFEQYRDTQIDMFATNKKIVVQWSSPKQVVSLFKDLDICAEAVSKTTGKKSFTVSAKEMSTVLMRDDLSDLQRSIIKKYLKFKKGAILTTTFGDKFMKYVHPITRRVHSSYNQILKTGRISSRSPNLQNIPSTKEFRSCFDAPKGYKIVNADYSGQEQIVLANKSMDEDLLNYYRSGNTDMHSFIASKLFNVPMEEIIAAKKSKNPTARQKQLVEFRQISKGAGFAINYGGDGYTISKNLGISLKEGEAVYNKYFEAFPGLKKFFHREQTRAVKTGKVLIDGFTNRFYVFEDQKKLQKGDPKAISTIKKQALNYPIQGTAGLITKTACIIIRDRLLAENLFDKMQITNIVHDEINMEALEEHSEYAAEVLSSSMEEAGDIWCKTIKLKADAVIGNYWNH